MTSNYDEELSDDSVDYSDVAVSNNDLNKFYNTFIKDTNIQLKRLNTFLKTYEKSLYNARLHNKHGEIETVRKTIAKYEEKIEEKQKFLTDLEERNLDNFIKGEILKSQKRSKLSNAIQIAKFKRKQQLKNEDKKILDKFYSKERKVNRSVRGEKWNMNKSFNFFVKVSNSLPQYMKKNLKEMPNNKGYIWKDIRFYGAMPAQKNQPDILFEKQRNGIMLIHEITKSEHKIFEKKGKEKRKLKTVKKRIIRT